MMNQPSSKGRSDKAWIIEAVYINCNKQFNSTRAVSMHLKATAARHAVSFINHGNYINKPIPVDKKCRVCKMRKLLSEFDINDKARGKRATT